MDCSLRIHHMGRNIEKLFPIDTILTERPLDEVFRLIRPDIHVEWDKVYQCFFSSLVIVEFAFLASLLRSTYCLSHGKSSPITCWTIG